MVRGTRAYLAGIGTAGALVLGAALVFVLAGAVVAFRGWPAPHTGGAPARQQVTLAAVPGPVSRRLAVISEVSLAHPATRTHPVSVATVGPDRVTRHRAVHGLSGALAPVPVAQGGVASQTGPTAVAGSDPVRDSPTPVTTTTVSVPPPTTTAGTPTTATVATVPTTTTAPRPTPTTTTPAAPPTTTPAVPPATTVTTPVVTTTIPNPGSVTIPDPVAPVVSGVGTVVSTVGTTVGSVGSTLGGTVGTIGSGTPLAPVTGTLGGAVGGTLDAVGSTLNGVGGLLGGS